MQKASELMVLDKILVRVKFVSRILNLCFKVGKEPRLCVNLVHSGGPNDTASVFDSFDCKNCGMFLYPRCRQWAFICSNKRMRADSLIIKIILNIKFHSQPPVFPCLAKENKHAKQCLLFSKFTFIYRLYGNPDLSKPDSWTWLCGVV